MFLIFLLTTGLSSKRKRATFPRFLLEKWLSISATSIFLSCCSVLLSAAARIIQCYRVLWAENLLYFCCTFYFQRLKTLDFTACRPSNSSSSGIHFKYFLDDLFPLVIAGFVPVLPEIDYLSPWFMVYLLPCACCQFVVLRIHCYRVLYFPVLPPARINHGIWANHLTESFNARRSAIDTFLFRIVPCNDLLSFISDYMRLTGKYRILSCQNF